jgi:CheY-like chemotaxis protein
MRGGAERRILLVEDDEAVREVVVRHLRKRRFTVEEAGSGEAVLQSLQAGELTYEVALIDVHLPGMAGSDLARLLLASFPLRPVIIITGDDDAELARRALGFGATGYLLKPFQMFELDAALVQAVSMLDLVEATAVLARAQAEHLDDWGEAGGQLPRAWLHLGDEQSGAGRGHGSRVVSVSSLLAKVGPTPMGGRELDVLRTAARTHEIGRLLGPGGGEEVARRAAQLLNDLGFDPDVAELVRQAAEPWSPGLPVGSRLLALADRLDHEAVQRLARSGDPGRAIRQAVDGMVAGSGETVDPELAGLLVENREAVESMWVVQLDPLPG